MMYLPAKYNFLMVNHLDPYTTSIHGQPAAEVSLVELNPTEPTSQDSITALFSDPDGDLVTVEYLWTIHGVVQPESSNTLWVHLLIDHPSRSYPI